jgi:hypothetical protein
MIDYIKEAKEFYEEAKEEFERGYGQDDKILMRDACEKGWGAIIQATNALFVKKRVERLPKSHRDRCQLLREMEKRYEEVKKLGLVDRFMARDHVLHMRGFYNGDIEPEEVRENFEKVKRYIEDIEKNNS